MSHNKALYLYYIQGAFQDPKHIWLKYQSFLKLILPSKFSFNILQRAPVSGSYVVSQTNIRFLSSITRFQYRKIPKTSNFGITFETQILIIGKCWKEISFTFVDKVVQKVLLHLLTTISSKVFMLHASLFPKWFCCMSQSFCLQLVLMHVTA